MSNASKTNSFLPPTTQADILIVDDVLENIRLLANLLECKGYKTRKAVSGKMAWTAIKSGVPSLILLDVRMPDISGFDFCQQLKSSPMTAHIPIIFLSAAADVTTKVQAFKVGGADYITKPFLAEEVLARVQHQITIITAQETICHLKAQLEEQV